MTEVITYARAWLGTPYLWGGNNPIVGWDCSAYICEILKAFAVLGPREDLSAAQLYLRLIKDGTTNTVPVVEAGQVLFFGRDLAHIIHVALAVSSNRMIESGGGGANITSLDLAAAVGAFVKERPIQQNLLAAVLPKYIL